MSKLNLLTICSGIGSPELGAMRVFDSVNIVAACEYDKFARQSYEANFEIDPKHFHPDVTTMDATPYHGKADGLIGGFPCQAFSVAGLRLGFNDPRGQIFYSCVRILKEVQPKFFIFENVKGLVGHDKEKDNVEEVCSLDLFGGKTTQKIVTKGKKYFSCKHKNKEIGRTLHTMERVLNETGYFWSWMVLNTKDFGVPQNRERIFMVGFKNEEDFKNFSFPMAFPLEKRLKDVLEEVVDAKYYLSDKILKGFKQHKQRHQDKGNGFKFNPTYGNGVGVCLGTMPGSRATDNYLKIAGMLDIKGTEQIRRVHETGGVSPSLTTMQGGHQEPKILQRGFPEALACASRGRNPQNPKSRVSGEPTEQQLEMNESGTSNCLTSVQKDNYVLKDFRIRKLTPLECFRLQDFPDSFKKVVSDSQLYKQAGNSMSVNVMEQLFKQIKKAMNTKVEEFVLDGLFSV